MRLKLPSRSSSSFVLSSLFGAIGLLVASCGGDEPVSGSPGTSTPDDEGADAASGNSDGEGNGNGDDESSEGDDTATTTTPTPTTTTTGENSTSELPLGTAIGITCEQDSNCASPLKCVRSDDSFRGSLPGTGICTMPCSDDVTCEAVDGLGFCALLGAPTDEAIAAAGENEIPEGFAGFCLQLCPFGLPTSKCGSSANSTCYPISEELSATSSGEQFQLGVCAPICELDSDCQDGEYCDRAWGMCVSEERPGKALGESCDWTAENNECAGRVCLSVSEDPLDGICSEPCNIHPDTIACGATPGPDAKFGCFWNLFASITSSVNDVGQCVPLCDDNDDCSDGLECVFDIIEGQQELYGRAGMCFPSSPSDAGAATSTEADPVTSEPANPDAGGMAAGDAG